MAFHLVRQRGLAGPPASGGHILDGQVFEDDIANNAVSVAKIQSNAVGSSEIANGAVINAKLGLSVGAYSWTASNASSSYTGSMGTWRFCAITQVSSGSSTSGTNIRNFVCAVHPSSLDPNSWIIESHGTVSTTCRARCF